MRKNEAEQASKIVGLNYSHKYKISSKKEIFAMFTDSAIPPKYIVAEENGKVIGFAGYTQSWMDYSVYNIFWVNVTPEYQGRGIGTKLMAETINRIKSINDKENPPMLILITATEKNTIFYKKKFGFKKMFKFKKNDYYLMGLDIQ